MIKIPDIYNIDPPSKSNDPPVIWSPVAQQAEDYNNYSNELKKIRSIENPELRQKLLDQFNYRSTQENKNTLRGDLPNYETFSPVEQFVYEHSAFSPTGNWAPLDMVNPFYYLNNIRKASDGIQREYNHTSSGGDVRTGNVIQIGLDIADGIPAYGLIAKFGKKAVMEFIAQEGIEKLIQYGIDNGWDSKAVESLRSFDVNEFFSIEEPNPDIKGWGESMPMI